MTGKSRPALCCLARAPSPDALLCLGPSWASSTSSRRTTCSSTSPTGPSFCASATRRSVASPLPGSSTPVSVRQALASLDRVSLSPAWGLAVSCPWGFGTATAGTLEPSSGKRRAQEPPECLGCPMGSGAAFAHCGCVRPKRWQQRGGGTRLNPLTQPWGLMRTVRNPVTQWCSPVQGFSGAA